MNNLEHFPKHQAYEYAKDGTTDDVARVVVADVDAAVAGDKSPKIECNARPRTVIAQDWREKSRDGKGVGGMRGNEAVSSACQAFGKMD